MIHRFGKAQVIIALVSIMVFIFSTANAGLLPDAKKIYGDFMPSLEFAIGRPADKIGTDDLGQKYSWENATDADYEKVDSYLSGCGCVLGESHVTDGILIAAVVAKNDLEIILTYNRADHIISMTYPSGTRPETEKTKVKETGKTLPIIRYAFGIEMPSLEVILEKKSDRESTDKKGNLPSFMIGRRVLVSKKGLQEWIDEQCKKGSENSLSLEPSDP